MSKAPHKARDQALGRLSTWPGPPPLLDHHTANEVYNGLLHIGMWTISCDTGLTTVVDTLDMCEPGARPAGLLIQRDARIQSTQLPAVTSGVVTRQCLFQVGAGFRPLGRLIDDLPLSQF